MLNAVPLATGVPGLDVQLGGDSEAVAIDVGLNGTVSAGAPAAVVEEGKVAELGAGLGGSLSARPEDDESKAVEKQKPPAEIDPTVDKRPTKTCPHKSGMIKRFNGGFNEVFTGQTGADMPRGFPRQRVGGSWDARRSRRRAGRRH